MRLGRQDLQLLSPLASGLAVTLGNATQVAQIKEEKSTLEQILGLSSDGILLLDGKGRVRVWNQAMERICGVASDAPTTANRILLPRKSRTASTP